MIEKGELKESKGLDCVKVGAWERADRQIDRLLIV